jgi:hypothetical protein
MNNEYDLVITGGRVIDPETGLDAVRNVGIKGDKIAAVTKEAIQGKETIDASGYVVAPGFIDGHVHGSMDAFAAKQGLRDGKTTQMDLEAGAWPVDVYYDRLEGRSQANYGSAVSHAGLRVELFDNLTSRTGEMFADIPRLKSMNWSTHVSTKDEIAQVLDKVETGLKRGGLGVGSPVGYMTGGVSSYEMNQIYRLSGKYGAFATVHGRFSSQALPTEGLLGTLEAIGSAAMYNCGLLVHHIHAQALSEIEEAARMVDDARDNGIRVIAEMYPYTFGGSILGADYLHPDMYQQLMGHSYDGITVVATGKRLDKETYEKLMKEAPATSIMFDHATEDDMVKAMAWPSICLGSDGMIYQDQESSLDDEGTMTVPWDYDETKVLGHPRTAASYAKVLRYTREKKVMPLMTAVAKTSYLLAKFMEENGVDQMAQKGRMQVGTDADITVFDPDTVTDNATLDTPGLASTGIPYVIVNGTVVVKDSEVLEGVYPGKPIRRPVTGH